MNSEPPPLPPVAVPPKKRDYLIPSILTTCLCCLPFGVVAIVCSVRANSAYDFGKFDEAERHAKHAFWWMITGVVGGFLGIAAYLLICLFAVFLPVITENCGNCEADYSEKTQGWTLPSSE